MKMHRFIGDFDLNQENIKIEDLEVLNQFKNVLRLKSGSKLILSDGNLNEAEAEIIKLNKDSAEINIVTVFKNKNELKLDIILYCAVLKRENFEQVAQKATEIGVREIAPIITKRTVKLDLKKERLEKIIKEAAEQSGRGIVPKLHDIKEFDDVIKESKSNDRNLFFDLSGDKLVSFKSEQGSRIGLFIGPEGGWDEEELKRAMENGFKLVSLGKTTLRAETAAILASYIAASPV